MNGRNPLEADGRELEPSVRDPAKPDSAERAFEFGGVNARYPPGELDRELCIVSERLAVFELPNALRFPLDSDVRLVAPRLLKLLVSRLAGMPALGRPLEFVPRAANSLFDRPPAGIAPT